MSAMVIGPVGWSDSRTRRRTAPAARSAAPATSAGRGLRLTTRGRIVLALLLSVALGTVFMLGTQATASGPEAELRVDRHEVVAGETLWQIAEGVARPGESVRDVVRELVRVNGLPSDGVMAGQVLVVPVRG